MHKHQIGNAFSYTRAESNRHFRLRRPALYPLGYGCIRTHYNTIFKKCKKIELIYAIFVQATTLFNALSPYLAQNFRSCAQFLCRYKNFVHARNFCAGNHFVQRLSPFPS